MLQYKTSFVTLVLVIGYAFMHVKLTGIYIDTQIDKFMHFDVRLPFAQRLFVPALANLLHRWLPLSVDEVFFLLEVCFVGLLFLSLERLLQFAFDKNSSRLLSWLFLLLLPLMSVVNYRYTTGGEATFFYPYDSACLFFMTLGFLLCLQKQWAWLTLAVFVATFNRESSFLLILLIPALHWREGWSILKPLLLTTLSYVIARLIILYLVGDLPGAWTEWYFLSFADTHFNSNLIWLLESQHLLFFMFCFAGLPLFWFAFYDYIPLQYRPIRYVAFLYFFALLFIGNFIEVRIFQEILILLYFPVCIAINNWLTQKEPYLLSHQGFIYYLERYAIFILVALILLLRNPLNQWALLLCS